ncbi:MAG: DNA polymerase III subunit gamma/tau [Agathobacter sp.]|uniref:DNA polymerase III subunit gamma/tau n=1 Tax=Agathobacter sp. TaxID=2021311 RepID=UPI00257E7B42|nr:DNA polymerase III subunit gamma/tau [Agathobacter sp.]MBQ1681810.1 DNA polymerase III subunit gamma/tau [Agathobacter sp.]
MAYTALYRKFRPQTFDEVKGQDHIVTTLKNQINANRMGHAYLFCGTRGTGKTSVAKIFARAINCEHPVDGSPCGECPTCKAIADGTSLNVIEIDAASNNGVDSIRQIRDEVAYTPAEGKYKVYIIDEVHMLTVAAFNALLKTLEEPPEYVVFILATTEYHKIPLTILSRCQKYDFHRITIDTITDRLMDLMRQENIEVEERAIRYVAKAGDGSMRDSLSLLDQCIAFHMGETLTYDKVLEVLGAADTEVFSQLLRAVIGQDVASALAVLDRLANEGRELSQAVNDFIWYLRNLLLVQVSDELEDVLDISTENLATLKEEAQMVEAEVLYRYIRVFSELSNQIKNATQKRILIEVAVIKLCKPEMESSDDSIVNRLNNLEKKVENGVVTVATAAPSHRNEPPAPLPASVPDDIKAVIRDWNMYISMATGAAKQFFIMVTPSLGPNGELLLVVDNPDAYEYLSENRANCLDLFRQNIQEHIGKEIVVTVRMNDTGKSNDAAYADLRNIDFDIELEEDEEEA